MLQSSARLLRLLSLLQSRRFWSGAELAERLEINPRTLRRDIDRLRSLGYPVQATPGVAGGYQLGSGASLPPLQLEDDEALAVSIALRTATASTVTGLEEPAIRALVKLERVLPSKLRHRANALRAAILPLSRPGPHVDAETLAILAAACSDHTQVHFAYAAGGGASSNEASGATASTPSSGGANATAGRKRSADEASAAAAPTTERVVDPVGLVHSGYRWYFVAWDGTRDDWRTFRVDRIRGRVTTGARFTPRSPPENGDLQKYVSRSVSVDVYGHRARVLLHAPIRAVRERISAAAGVLEPLDENRCILSTGAHSLDSLAFWITMLGVDFEVQEPAELFESLQALHARLGRALSRA